MTEKILTRKQIELFRHLAARARAGGVPPTLDEICAELGLRSRGSLHKHVAALVEAGLVEASEGRRRGLRVVLPRPAGADLPPEEDVPGHSDALYAPASAGPVGGGGELPLVGRIAAGRPIEALETADQFDFGALVTSGTGPHFVLKVTGDSMVDAGILDGDYVVVRGQPHARNGEIVVALIDGEEATLKRIRQRPGVVELWPENSSMEAMRYAPERVAIQGIVVGQARTYL